MKIPLSCVPPDTLHRFFTSSTMHVILMAVFLMLDPLNMTVYAQTITNIRYYYVAEDKITIYYDLNGTEASDISVRISYEGAPEYTVNPSSLSGDAGDTVSPGAFKRIVWHPEKPFQSLPDNFHLTVVTGSIPAAVPLYIEEKKTILAYPAQFLITMDGDLDEPFWQVAVPITDFTQKDPDEGAPASEKTEVRVIYDSMNLYIGVRCFDSEPEKIIRNEMTYDGYLSSDDTFAVLLDTFNDKRNGFYFCVNPNGARLDGKVGGSGTGGRRRGSDGSTQSRRSGTRIERINVDWNGIWDVSAKITDYGWTAEIIIPFKTLRFNDNELQNWGVNFRRFIIRKNEEVLWTSWGRDDGLLQLTKAGMLEGMQDIKRGNKFEIKPYLLGNIEREDNDTDADIKYGIDVKYPLTSDLTLNVTSLTDFAQVEADRTVINLTRFDYRYPEKREFFLEGAEIFDFSMQFSSPFYSRKIGLTPDRDQVPILGGAKVTGKVGRYNLGIMNMQTDAKYGFPSTNYSVLRVEKDIWEKSSVGMIATNIFSDGDNQDQSFGADFSYRTNSFLNNRNLEIHADLAENRKTGISSDNRSSSLVLYYPNDQATFGLIYRSVGKNFDPEMGFVSRNGIKHYLMLLDYMPRPDIPGVKQLLVGSVTASVYTDMDDVQLSRSVAFTPIGVTTKTEDSFSLRINNNYEYFDEEYDFFQDIAIPLGEYEWWSYSTLFRSNISRPVSCDLGYKWGNYYDGTKKTIETTLNVIMNKYISFSSYLNYNDLLLNSQRFDTCEYSLRLNTNISPRLTARTYLQWNNDDKLASLNFRVHFIPQIGSDVYFVYNHILDGYQDYSTSFNTAIAKIAYMVNF